MKPCSFNHSVENVLDKESCGIGDEDLFSASSFFLASHSCEGLDLCSCDVIIRFLEKLFSSSTEIITINHSFLIFTSSSNLAPPTR